MSSFPRRKIGVPLVAAVLLAPWTAAAESGALKDAAGIQSPWDRLARLWSAVTALWSEEGCSVDPYGRCGAANSPAAPAEKLDNGCKIDPFGGCKG
jgi:hypothetical protein